MKMEICVSICLLVLWMRSGDYPTKEVCQLHVSKLSFYRMSSSTSLRSDFAVLFVHKTDRVPCVTSLQCKRSQRVASKTLYAISFAKLSPNTMRKLYALINSLAHPPKNLLDIIMFIFHFHYLRFLNILIIIYLQ